MKLSNNTIKSILGLRRVTAGLAGAPTDGEPSVYLDGVDPSNIDGAHEDEISLVGGEALAALLNTSTPPENYHDFIPNEVFQALSVQNRAVIHTGRVLQAFASEAVLNSVPYEYVEHYSKTLNHASVNVPSQLTLPAMWVIDGEAINIPDVENYSRAGDNPEDLLLPLNFEVVRPEYIHCFLGKEVGENS